MTVKDKIKKFNYFLQESVEAVKTIIYIFQGFNMLHFGLFWTLIMRKDSENLLKKSKSKSKFH